MDVFASCQTPRRSRVSFSVSKGADEGPSALLYPFIQQIDVVISQPDFGLSLSKLETYYGKGKTKLVPLVKELQSRPPNSHLRMSFLSINRDSDDYWCIDGRGIFTLYASKNTYERLGIVGTEVPFKSQKGCHGKREIYDMHVQNEREIKSLNARQWNALGQLDYLRERDGMEPWTVIFSSPSSEGSSQPANCVPSCFDSPKTIPVACTEQGLHHVHIPVIPQTLNPQTVDADAMEDWNASVAEFFEWVGMAYLGAQRLYLNDRVDPYIAVYEPPPSRAGSILVLRWRGLLSPQFAQAIIDRSRTLARSQDKVFAAVTLHTVPTSPVSYVSPSGLSGDLTKPVAPVLRIPQEDAEHTISFLLTNDGCIAAECVGADNARWG
ncbi:hypothetical protein FISHEDRAFT_72168 [Fistulina hepatica ATCC 64428]|uniref:Uncharacterized protein n=1 Tax=Fistulina hepatica ATCC 64428 TaxID=1128425 RepID=A0A0D7AGG9_9AGAR|nr:hypothetical protein FISHEDRAFT_72168 [Fistulina hepatica ATCC 64428]